MLHICNFGALCQASGPRSTTEATVSRILFEEEKRSRNISVGGISYFVKSLLCQAVSTSTLTCFTWHSADLWEIRGYRIRFRKSSLGIDQFFEIFQHVQKRNSAISAGCSLARPTGLCKASNSKIIEYSTTWNIWYVLFWPVTANYRIKSNHLILFYFGQIRGFCPSSSL